MWMAELAARSGLPVATIKFYLREGLLHPGEAAGATRARYDESHVRRLRLVRALTEVAQLRLDAVRQVLAAMDDPALSRHEAIGTAHVLLSPDAAEQPAAAQVDRVEALLARQGWELARSSPHRRVLANALSSLEALGYPPDDALLDSYARAVDQLATDEVATLQEDDRVQATEHAVVSTLLLEPVLLALRRIAQENASRRLQW